MANLEIAYRRLINQQITRPVTANPAEVVQHLGAVQAQDYRAARWALGLRVKDATEASIEQALSDGKILRTHVLRPTWHYVVPEDIRWMLALTGPRVMIANGTYYRRFELDKPLFIQVSKILEKALQGGKQLTRQAVITLFEQAGIAVYDKQRNEFILMQAELEGIICSGARQGNLITYTLLEERVPPAPAKKREEAVVELVRRFFNSHGPANIPDFVWWSGLMAADARFGLDALGDELAQETIDGQTYWSSSEQAPAQDLKGSLHLLPNYDEYVVSYKNRTAIEDLALTPDLPSRRNYLFNHVIIINGRLAGLWKRNSNPKQVTVTYEAFRPFSAGETEALNKEAERLGWFLGVGIALETGIVGAEKEKAEK